LTDVTVLNISVKELNSIERVGICVLKMGIYRVTEDRSSMRCILFVGATLAVLAHDERAKLELSREIGYIYIS
jgi:hypothetical protein